MTIRGFVVLAFILNLLFSNVCLIGSTYAATPASSAAQEVLSREVPMSFNVVTCAWLKTEDGWAPAADSPCASGQCLKKSNPDTRWLFQATAPRITVHFPVAFPADAVLALVATHDVSLDAQPPRIPPPYPGLASTVMLM